MSDHPDTVDKNINRDAKKAEFPPRIFLYTLDQVALCLEVQEIHLRSKYIYFTGRTKGRKTSGYIVARNIAPEGSPPAWRVAETELVRWMRYKGFVYDVRGKIT